jgi:hypothetical protein
MSRSALFVALGIFVATWLPYSLVKIYWLILCETVPGADHGEMSGPVLFFLPRLLVAAVLVSSFVLAASAISYFMRLRLQR